MKKIFFLLLISTASFSQNKLIYDTLIVNQAYSSYYSFKYKSPIVVSYVLYHGGGDCSREHFKFKNDILRLKSNTDDDFYHSGYDRGHMANAEDFANNCFLDELTFRYYNCTPQTPELNRGGWENYEEIIREISQYDSLKIICYNEFDGTKKGNLFIPTKCYKFVYDLRKKKIIIAFYYTNTSIPKYKDILGNVKEYEFINKLIK